MKLSQTLQVNLNIFTFGTNFCRKNLMNDKMLGNGLNDTLLTGHKKNPKYNKYSYRDVILLHVILKAWTCSSRNGLSVVASPTLSMNQTLIKLCQVEGASLTQ
jgi:hypothetical protein